MAASITTFPLPVQIYNEAADLWEHVADMSVARHDAGCVTLGSRIYVIGGMQTPSPYCLDTLECFDTANGTWQPISKMPYPAAGVTCCAFGN